MSRWKRIAIAGLVAAPMAQAQAGFMLIDGMGGNVMAGASRAVTYYPLPQTSTTTNGSSFGETGGIADITLGGNGNTAGALELTYTFSSPVDLTDGGANTQFFLVANRIDRSNYDPYNGIATALSTTIYVTDADNTSGGFNTGIGNAPEGHSLVLNFTCATNSVCFTPQPDFTRVKSVQVRFAYPQNYDTEGLTSLTLDSIYATPTGAVFPPEFTAPAAGSATLSVGSAGSIQFEAGGAPTPTVSVGGVLPDGVSFNAATNTLGGTPAAGTGGQYPIEVTAANSVGQSTRTFTLNVEGPPTITTTEDLPPFSERRSDSFVVAATGYPEPVFTLTAGSLPAGVSLNGSSGAISGTPTNAAASYTFTVTAGNGLTPDASRTFTMTVNRAPQVNNFSATIAEDGVLDFAASPLTVSDADGDTVTVTIDTLPAHGTLTLDGNPVSAGQSLGQAALAGLRFTPEADWHGTTLFAWSAFDGTVWSASASATMTVTAVNDGPVITQGASGGIVVDEDMPAVFNLSATDADGDTLAWRIATPPGNGAASVVNGSVTYLPAPNAYGNDSFVVEVSDGNGGTASYSASVSVNPVNDLPVITGAGSVVMDEDGAPAGFALTLNASDVDSSTLTWSVGAQAAHGIAAVAGTGAAKAIAYVPTANYHGGDTFTIRVTDEHGGVADHVVNVTVTARNDLPMFAKGAVSNVIMDEDGSPAPFALTLTASDADGDTLAWSIVTQALHGTAAVTGSGTARTIAYTPTADYHGSDTFVIQVDDGNGAQASHAVQVTITSRNDAPLFSQGATSAIEMDEDGNPRAFALTLTASDVDGDPLSWGISGAAGHGTASLDGVDGSRTVAYLPAADYNGSDSFTVEVGDGKGGTAHHEVTVTIAARNDLPVIVGTPAAQVTEGSTYGYALTASDVDGGDVLVRSAPVLPPWLSFAAETGVLSGTPGNGDVGTHDVTLRVSDGTATVDQSFTITVVNVNDGPTIAGSPAAEVLVGGDYDFTPVAADPDRDAVLSFTIANAPAWTAFDPASGRLTGRPGAAHAGTYAGIVITVSDGELSAALPPFGVTVLGDLDQDGIADGDDDDIDGDGIDNAYERRFGLDEFNPTDAALDLDGDGLTALEEYLADLDPGRDDVPPLLTVPADVTVPATGRFTRVELGTATAWDAADGDLAAGNDAPVRFAPGRHQVSWSARDAAGNAVTQTQTVEVIPMVELAPDAVAAEGGSITVKVALNGPAARYPVEVPYTVSGSAEVPDHDLRDGTFTITAPGATEAGIVLHVAEDGAGEGEETVIITLGTPVNAIPGPHGSQVITLVEGNVAPRVRLLATQGTAPTRLVAGSGGTVVVSALVDDPNPADVHQYDWLASDNHLIDLDGDPDTFTLDPATLAPGPHTLRVHVSDGGAGADAELELNLLAQAPALDGGDSDGDGIDDATEGFGDNDGDGVPDYLDAVSASNVLQTQAGESESGLMETEPGLLLSLGSTAFRSGRGGAGVTMADLAAGDDPAAEDGLAIVGGLFDFEVSALPSAGQSVRVVLPQQAAIPSDAVYRKLMPAGWQDFVEDGANRLASAPGEQDSCPPPGDSTYADGLAAGHWCVQLTLQDGGPNDSDGAADGTVRDPGGVASNPAEPEPDTGSGASTGGSGAWSPMMLMLLFGLGWFRSRGRRN